MAIQSEPPYFKEARERGETVVSEAPRLDLESYIANYKGRSRIDRLYHIATTSTNLYHEALLQAVAEAKAGRDVELYDRVTSLASWILPDEPRVQRDVAWVERTEQEVKAETTHLELELKGYKNNLIKESIRMAYDDTGRHYQDIGNLNEAAKAYNKEREFCQTPAHVAIMNFRLINLYIDQKNWQSVESHVMKLRNLIQSSPDSAKNEGILSAAMGLAQMAHGEYLSAAESFLGCNPALINTKLAEADDPGVFNPMITPNDVATYGTLCALATMDRKQLQAHALDNAGFRQFLELEPHLRRTITFFVTGRFSSCLGILESYRPDYLLDLHLSTHFKALFELTRNKAIVQHFIPFSRVTFEALAEVFNMDEPSIQKSLIDLISSKSLLARLDMEHRVLIAESVELRRAVHQDALDTAKAFERTAHQRILRMEVISAGLEVNAPKSQIALGGQQEDGSTDILMGMEQGKGKGKSVLRGTGRRLMG